MSNNTASSKIDMRGADLAAPTQQTARLERLLDEHRVRLDEVSKALPSAPVANMGADAAGALQSVPATSVQSPSIADAAGLQVAPPPGSLQGESLVAALTRIQRGDLAALTGGNLALAARLATPQTVNVVRELRGTSFAAGLGHVEGAMLDIVALLFDQILASRDLPPRMKGLICRLQIPILKVAMLDNRFLCVSTHPARRLLDTMSAIATSLDDDLDESSPLHVQLRSTVRELVEGFEDSMDIFVRLHEELEGFVAAQNQPAAKQVRRVARRIEYRERLALAKAAAQQEILQRAGAGSVPRVVLRFLAEHWVKVMLVAHAKHGDQSDAWSKAVATMDLLIWSVRPKHALAERRTLAGVLPRLLRRLNTAMRNLGIEDDECKRFFVKLMRCHTDAMSTASSMFASAGGEPSAAAPGFCALTIRNPFGEGNIDIEEISLSELSADGRARGDGYSRVAGSLAEGAWVDFRDENGSKRRACLSYLSPLRRTCVFVTTRSGNVWECSLDRLAYELRAGRASVVEARSLFERAMSGLGGAQRASAALH